VLSALLVFVGLGAVLGACLGLVNVYWRPESSALIDSIEQCLPRTQCAQCGYPGCRPYAEAVAQTAAPINLCPPGGQATVDALAVLLGETSIVLRDETNRGDVAVIDESECIGCTLCLDACPVDAIVGASRLMHTVIVVECTGCELCVPPCPVDCISMVVTTLPRVELDGALAHG
jgi:electron transport complex protein RnfB